MFNFASIYLGQVQVSSLLLGRLSVFASALFFYLATVIIYWASELTDLNAAQFAFARFLLGFLIMLAIVFWPIKQGTRKVFQPRRWWVLAGRSLSNLVAVYCLYRCIEERSLAEANILNMCYPIYVTIASLLIYKSRDYNIVFLSIVSFIGVYLVIVSGGAVETSFLQFFGSKGFSEESLWGIASGIFAAISIICLQLAREVNSSEEVMLSVFSIALVSSLFIFWSDLAIPNGFQFLFLFSSAAAGVVAQYLITIGFRYVSASEGSIISTTRILLAALLGPLITSEVPLSVFGFVGAAIIFVVNIKIALRHN